MPMFLTDLESSSSLMFAGVAIPVVLLSLTNIGEGGPLKEDRLGAEASRSRSCSEAIIGLVTEAKIQDRLCEGD